MNGISGIETLFFHFQWTKCGEMSSRVAQRLQLVPPETS